MKLSENYDIYALSKEDRELFKKGAKLEAKIAGYVKKRRTSYVVKSRSFDQYEDDYNKTLIELVGIYDMLKGKKMLREFTRYIGISYFTAYKRIEKVHKELL